MIQPAPGHLKDLDSPKILLIRFARLGDLILLVPTIKALRGEMPDAHIAVLVGHRCAPILEMCSAVNEVIAVDRIAMRDGNKLSALWEIFKLAERIRKERYDLVLDFHGFRETNILSWYSRAPWRLGLKRAHSAYLPFCFNLGPVIEDKAKHVSEVFLSLLRPLGVLRKPEDIQLDLSPSDSARADDFLRRHEVTSDAVLLGFHVGAGSLGRVWPQHKFAELGERLIVQYKATIILFSGPRDGDFSKQVADLVRTPTRPLVADKLSLRELAAVICRCKLLVSNDTGPMHLGPAVGVSTLGLFSLGYPENYCPLGRFSRFVKRQPIESMGVDEVYGNVVEMLGDVLRGS
jgi:lipopolysaccharide heptosyltransferase II